MKPQATLKEQIKVLKDFNSFGEELVKNNGVALEGAFTLFPDMPFVLQQLKTELKKSEATLLQSEQSQNGEDYNRHIRYQQKTMRRLTIRAKSLIGSLQQLMAKTSSNKERTEKILLLPDDRIARLEGARALGRGAKDPLGFLIVLTLTLANTYLRNRRG